MENTDTEQAKHELAKAVQDALKLISDGVLEASNKIANDANKATSAMASAALDANRLLASQASVAAKVVDTKQGNDHDLILEVKTIQTVMLGEIREIKDGTAKQLSDLQSNKLDIKDSYPVMYKKDVETALTNHEGRVKILETNMTRIIAYGVALMVVVGLAEFLIGKFWD